MAEIYGLGHWPDLGTFGVALPLLFSITVIGTDVWALGEELGWRGFLFPRLQQRFGFHGACLISGGLWAMWHFPELLWADYNAGTNAIYAMVCFTAGVVAMAYIMGYLRMRSGSIWPCVLIHATHNTFVQGIFDPLTAPVGLAKYITTEFGAGLALSIVLAATIIILQGGRDEGPSLGRDLIPEKSTDPIKRERAHRSRCWKASRAPVDDEGLSTDLQSTSDVTISKSCFQQTLTIYIFQSGWKAYLKR